MAEFFAGVGIKHPLEHRDLMLAQFKEAFPNGKLNWLKAVDGNILDPKTLVLRIRVHC